MFYIRRKWKSKGWQGRLVFFGFSFHPKSEGGVYHNGKNWIIWSAFNSLGFNFDYAGGETYWLWPWKRKGTGAWYQLDCGGCFRTLKEIKKFWKEYNKELIKRMEGLLLNVNSRYYSSSLRSR